MSNKILRDYAARSRMRFRIKIFLLSGLLLFFLVLIAYVIIYSPAFRINKIEIEGVSQTNQSEVSQYFYSRLLGSETKNILGFYNFLIWPNQINENELSLLPIAKEINFTKDYFNHNLIINVVERQPFGIWCFEKNNQPNCVWFDSEGVVFKKAFATEGNILISVNDYSQPVAPIGSKILPADFISNFFGIIQVLKEANLNIKEIKLNNLNLEEMEIDLISGPKLYFSLRFNPLNDLSVIDYLQQNQKLGNLQYVDFRSESRAFYK